MTESSATAALVRVRALAKINLTLRVLGVRADGYHEVRTIFQSIALHDTLTIRVVRGSLRLLCNDPSCPPDRTNLVWQAAERLWTAAGRRGAPRDLVIRLATRIPIQAGLGGGSSDAAAALRALERLWAVDRARVLDVAATLGADVPYFFEGGTVLGVERGDLLFPLIDVPARWVTLVIPRFGVSTKDAYSWFDHTVTASPISRGASQNDLQAPVAAHHPEIASLVAALGRCGASQAAMCGSGSAVFGLFERRSDAEKAARVLTGSRQCPVLVTRTVNRADYQRLAGNS